MRRGSADSAVTSLRTNSADLSAVGDDARRPTDVVPHRRPDLAEDQPGLMAPSVDEGICGIAVAILALAFGYSGHVTRRRRNFRSGNREQGRQEMRESVRQS